MNIETLPFDAVAFATYTLSSAANLAAVLDHTLLKPEATRSQVIQLCHESAEHRFACAMVNPYWVSVAAVALAGTGVPVGVVVGFPLGATLSASKRDETTRVLKSGAHDVDMVLNVGLLKSGTKEDFDLVRQDIRGVVELAHGAGAIVKVILETCLLTFEEKLRASEIALSASKRDETARVVKQGAHDVDMVLNVGLLKSGTREDFEAVRQLDHAANILPDGLEVLLGAGLELADVEHHVDIEGA